MTNSNPSSETPATPKLGRKSIQKAESKLEVLPPEQAQALFSSRAVEDAVSVLKKNLNATKRMWSQAAHDFVEIPDGPTQIESAKTILAYGLGRPIERQVIEHRNIDSMDDLKAKLAGNPALCGTLQAMLDEAARLRETAP